MVKQEQFAAALLQTVIGTAVAVNPVTHYIQFSELELTANNIMEKVDILSGKFTTEPKIKGNMNVSVKGKIPFCSKSAIVAPECDLILQALGFTPSVDETPVAGSKFIYTRGMTIKDFSAVQYLCKGNSAILYSAHSIMLNNGKITTASGKTPMLEFAGVGLVGGLGVADFESVATITKPTQTKIAYYTANDVATTLLDTGYELVAGGFEFVNKISQRPTMVGLGFGLGEMADQETKFNGSILLDTTLSSQPLNRIRSNTTPGTFSITYGSIVGRRVSITSTKAQLVESKPAMQGDIMAADLGGDFVDNEIVITFNSDIT